MSNYNIRSVTRNDIISLIIIIIIIYTTFNSIGNAGTRNNVFFRTQYESSPLPGGRSETRVILLNINQVKRKVSEGKFSSLVTFVQF